MGDTIAWPRWMPAPQQDSFSIQPEDRRLTSETEAGAIVRYQFDSDVNIADCTLILNRVQAAWFEFFERDMVRHGTVWFDFPLWIGGEVVYETCRFKTRPKAGSLIGLHTTYTFQLYVSKRSQLPFPKCIAELFVCYPPCFFMALDAASARLAAATPSWLEKIRESTAEIFSPLFGALSSVTEEAVSSALSELQEA